MQTGLLKVLSFYLSVPPLSLLFLMLLVLLKEDPIVPKTLWAKLVLASIKVSVGLLAEALPRLPLNLLIKKAMSATILLKTLPFPNHFLHVVARMFPYFILFFNFFQFFFNFFISILLFQFFLFFILF